MPNRVSREEQCEKDPAKRDKYDRVLQRRVSTGGQPDAPSLRVAVDRLIADIQARGGPAIEVCDDLTIGELGLEFHAAAFSIVQELLLNACRHSKSENVLLGLAEDKGHVCIQVQDWGVGFDLMNVQRHKRGLKGVRDLVAWLGGSVAIDSQPGMGTCITVEIPLSRETGSNVMVRASNRA